MRITLLKVILIMAATGFGVKCYAQDQFALKTNFLYAGAALAPNLSIEFGTSGKTTLDISFGYNGWNLNGSDDDNKKIAHWIVSPEIRYWTCERFLGHFIGFHPFYARYNISEKNLPLLLGKNSKDHRFEGYITGAGVSYGYQLVLHRNFNLEFNLGVGYGYMKYDKFECGRCGEIISDGKETRHYFGPTRAGITLVYLFK